MPRDADNRAYLLCSECESPVYVNDGEHHCACDPEPDGYRMGDVGDVAAEFQGNMGVAGDD